jgi:hypothetical protein
MVCQIFLIYISLLQDVHISGADVNNDTFWRKERFLKNVYEGRMKCQIIKIVAIF